MPEPQLSTSTLGFSRSTAVRRTSVADAVQVDLRTVFGGCKRPHQTLIDELKQHLSELFSRRIQSIRHLVPFASHPEYEVLLLGIDPSLSSCDIIAEAKARALALHEEHCP